MPREPNQWAPRSQGPYPLQSTTALTRHVLRSVQKAEAGEALHAPPSPESISREAVPGQVVPEIKLSKEQNEVLETVLKGGNVFFTGPAGCGKSVLLRAIIQELLRTKPPDSIAVTATTGIASLAISGQTLHSYGGIGYGNEVAEILVKKINRSRENKTRWKRTQVWIIDEISMLKAELFDKLEYIAQCIRDDSRPFGGIQLVLAGDFFQLPPVSKKGNSRPPDYAFSAKSWKACIPHPHFLDKVFRQKDDGFISLLSAMRVGSLTQQHKLILQNLERPLICNADVQPAMLLPSKVKVEQHNLHQLERLPGGTKTFFSMDSAGWDAYRKPLRKADAQKLLNSVTLAPRSLTLKVGAQVMLIQNVVQNVLVNGSIGKVIEFITIREARKRGVLMSQPQSSDPELSDDLDSEDGLDYDEDANWQKPPTRPLRYQHRTYIEERILASYQDDPTIPQRPTQFVTITDNAFLPSTDEYPLVHFTNDSKMLCVPLFFDNVGIMGNIEARRVQVPLILSWAITIHKAQGQTLDHVKVDFSNIFAEGQAYVAVSRATSMEGLQLMNFQADKIFANSRVLEWHNYWQNWWSDKRRQWPAEVSTQLSTTSDDSQFEDDYDSYNTEIPASWLEEQTLC